MAWIDLRSDTVTLPTSSMKKAMLRAALGDDVFGDDPTVRELESLSSELFKKEAALFVSSGTQSNLLALMSHCERGDEYICGQEAHLYKWEGGGAAVLGSIQPQPIEFEEDGTLDLKKVKKKIKPDDPHFAKTRLLCLENTLSGKVLPLSYFPQVKGFAVDQGLRLHLDGARIFNAAVHLKISVTAMTDYFDSVSICLSKGLGAPVGSVLCGSKELIQKARRWRKVLGGGMRQSGILAAAGIYALQNHVERLEEDHVHAQLLGQELADISGLQVGPDAVQTNMVFVGIKNLDPVRLASSLRAQGILISPRAKIRLVTHLDISKEDVKKVVAAFRHSVRECANESGQR